MTQTIPVSIRIASEKAVILDEMARGSEQSRNQLINAAIDTYIEMRQQWDQGIIEALREVEADQVVAAEKVFARLEKKFDL